MLSGNRQLAFAIRYFRAQRYGDAAKAVPNTGRSGDAVPPG